ncbi:hypothetical protein [Citrobacter farmeri]|uniref:hypothetical protein n=1 Tax=Citrobacter farmeri TaxID=67824 RepID=UPI00293145BA|nr:hypothetical protein [Citrobacter farmeri]
MKSHQDGNTKQNFYGIPLTILISSFAFICGFSYLCGFWYNFNISLQLIVNILSPLDVIKSFIIPLASVLGVYSIHLLMNIINNTNPPELEKFERSLDEGKNESKLYKIASSQYTYFTILALAGTIYILYKFATTSNHVYFNGFIIGAVGLLFTFTSIPLVYNWDVDAFAKRLIVIAAICFLPAMLYFIGFNTGEKVINNPDTMIMIDNSACSKNPDEDFLLLSLYGNKAVSLSLNTRAVCLFNSDDTNFRSRNTLGAPPSQFIYNNI